MRLVRNQWMLAAAESCTGGLVAKMCTDIPGSSRWFERGFVTYANDAKIEMLGVPATILQNYGAVSYETVHAMLQGALNHSHAQCALAISGIAGPDGGTAEKPVGLVYIGVAIPNSSQIKAYHFPGDRQAIREAAARQSLTSLLNLLEHP